MFQKKARSQEKRYQFTYGGEVFEHSTSNTYLGIQISASGGFSLAVKVLNERAIVLFYFIVCYLLNIVLFYSKYDVCSRM